MPGFDYRALTADGRPQSGVLEAPTAAAARQTLRAQGLFPLAVEARGTAPAPAPQTAAGGAAPAPAATPRPARGGALPPVALALVARQLASLLAAGLRVEEALATVAAGQPPRVALVVLDLRARIVAGQSLGDACDALPQHFGAYVRAAIRAGDRAGRLDVVLDQLAAHLEARAQGAQTLQLALIYPALLALVSLTIVVFLMTHVVPDIARVFAARGADLPALTRALLALSEGLRAWGPAALAGLAAVAFMAGRWLRAEANRRRLDALVLAARGSGALVRQIGTARFTTTLATLLEAQVPLVEALAAAVSATPNLALRDRIAAAAEKVRQGTGLHRALAEAQVFPPMVLAMVASGEASGRLAQALSHAAREQTRGIEARAKTAVALFEPAILLVMGGLVTLIVLAILLPIVSLNDLAGG